MIPVIGALLIGLTLGLLGSGGSILTVPVLVYLIGHNSKVAIAESLVIVGTISFFGMVPYARSKQVDWRSVIYFGIPGMIGTYGGAWLSHFVSGTAQLVLFAVVMLAAAGLMIRKSKLAEPVKSDQLSDVESSISVSVHHHPLWKIAIEGLVVGVLTGLVGVGGGFLIVPALVILGGLDMHRAVGTSLAIIGLKSLTGFYKYLGVLGAMHLSIDWATVGLFIAVGVIGTVIGKQLSNRMNQVLLRRVFAGFLLVMGFFVLGREVPSLMVAHVGQQRSEQNNSTLREVKHVYEYF